LKEIDPIDCELKGNKQIRQTGKEIIKWKKVMGEEEYNA
jgi:hypothetical protein